MLLSNVALGKSFTQLKRDGSISSPPKGYDSVHGDPNAEGSEFDDDEFCIYRDDRFHMKYMIEFKM